MCRCVREVHTLRVECWIEGFSLGALDDPIPRPRTWEGKGRYEAEGDEKYEDVDTHGIVKIGN